MLLQTLPFFPGNDWCYNSRLVKRFMKSVFVCKKPKPKYLFTWDVSIVLKYLKSLMPLDKLSLKMLTLKTVALIALATAPRAQTLVSLNINNMFVEQQAVVFYFSNFLKTTRDGHKFSLTIEHFNDEDLCAMHTLLKYLEFTANSRIGENVFISYVTSKHVTSSTIARWLKVVLQKSGVDVDSFKAHSFRGASVSAAYHNGCSINNILKTADWKSDKNFKKFYFRHELKESNISFSNAVFRPMI